MFKKVTFIGLLFCLFVTIGTSVFASSGFNVLNFYETSGITREYVDSKFEAMSGYNSEDYVMYINSSPRSDGELPGVFYFQYIPKSTGISYLDFSSSQQRLIAYNSNDVEIPYDNLNCYGFYYSKSMGGYLGLPGGSLYCYSIMYSESDLDIYYDGVLCHDGSYSNLPAPQIILDVTYDDVYSKAIFSADVSNAREGDKLYYSTLVDARNNLINPIEVKYGSIYTVNANRNGMLFFHLLDSDGNLVCAESVYLKSLDNFDSDNFDISMESMTASMYNYWVRVKGKYTDSIEGSYYDCYVSYTLSDTKNTYAGLNLDGLTNIESDEAIAYSQDTFYAFNPSIDFFDVHTTTKNVNVSVIFKFVNKETGYTCGYKRVDFVVSSAQNPLYPQYRFYF